MELIDISKIVYSKRLQIQSKVLTNNSLRNILTNTVLKKRNFTTINNKNSLTLNIKNNTQKNLYNIGTKINGNKYLNQSLKENDPEIFDLIEKEKKRQYEGINLIPSENYTSQAVLQALGSILQNKYSEGYPGSRYYGGNQYIDKIELLCQKRALEAFNLNSDEWGVNVQALSGSPANMYVYSALLNTHDRIMGLDLPHGGHLSHGYQTLTKKVSAVSKFFETMPFYVNEKTGMVDYDNLELLAKSFRPKLIVAGSSAYSRNFNYKRLRQIADKSKAYLMADIAHISGMLAAGFLENPFKYCDVVTTTTHKSLRGPRGAMIFYRKGVRKITKKNGKEYYNLEKAINSAVFPQHQGGPHNHTIAALAVALKQAKTDWFKEYQNQVLKNSKTLEMEFKRLGYQIISNGTDIHMMIIDLRSKKIDGSRVEKVLEMVNISANKNTIPGDKSAVIPSGLRVGSPAMTTRELKEDDFKEIANFVDQAIKITIKINHTIQGKLSDFKKALQENKYPEIEQLKKDVINFSRKFPVVGFDFENSLYCN